MDELTLYLQSTEYYAEYKLEQILNEKIIITDDHIKNIDFNYYESDLGFNIITLFEKYGYVFTNNDYILLVSKSGSTIKYISEDKQTNKICKTAVKQYGFALEFISDDKKTNEICKMAVLRNKTALCYVPDIIKHVYLHKMNIISINDLWSI